MSNSRATIRDVAFAAGVSTATVSRFLNCSGYVNDTTAARIRNAIDQTGYTPSLMARGLKTRHSRMLLLIVLSLTGVGGSLIGGAISGVWYFLYHLIF